MKKQTKVIYKERPHQLEAAVNDFLQEKAYKDVLDIQFQHGQRLVVQRRRAIQALECKLLGKHEWKMIEYNDDYVTSECKHCHKVDR